MAMCLAVSWGLAGPALINSHAAEKTAPVSAAAVLDDRALAARIDQLLTARWTAKGVKPAPQTDDAEFIRRVYLDLAGRIPSIIEVRDFLDDQRPEKRRIWVDRLLAEPSYANHFANVWRALLLSQANSETAQGLAPSLEVWLRQRLQKNAGYDEMVREILTAAPNDGTNASPSAFYQAGELKAENLAASTSRLFLGINLGCAQCHKHPFARWTRNQFWEFAAFFAEIDAQRGQVPGRRELQIPGTQTVVQARFLNGAAPRWKPDANARVTLAEWLTAADNPFFARAAVNHLWTYFFGVGLAESGEQADEEIAANHAELLGELARQFTLHHHDLKYLIRALVASRAYQLTSEGTHSSQEQPRVFGRMAVRAMTPEQLFDSLAEATEYRDPYSPDQRLFLVGVSSPRADFLAKFPPQDNRIEARTSIQQALFLMNGKFMADATSLERNRTLTTVAEAASTSTVRRIETLYLVALCRKPRADEAARLLKYVDSGGPSGDPKKALADIFWALLNSGEFMMNH
jgi:hypothetical protein